MYHPQKFGKQKLKKLWGLKDYAFLLPACPEPNDEDKSKLISPIYNRLLSQAHTTEI
jgi:hypothetical protein